jgi:threonine/homoserine/homoserine lactone efflux protein
MATSEFLITSLIVVLVPGTGVIFTVSTGLLRGWRYSIAAACGCTLGIVPHLLASILGLAAILHMSALAFQLLKFAGVVYLLYLAWGMWRDTGSLQLENVTDRKGVRQTIMRGILINILNPKLSLFFLAFLPQFVNPTDGSTLLQMLLLSGIFMLMTLLVFILYGIFAHGVRRQVSDSPKVMRWLQRGFAAGFAALGCKLALTDQ